MFQTVIQTIFFTDLFKFVDDDECRSRVICYKADNDSREKSEVVVRFLIGGKI